MDTIKWGMIGCGNVTEVKSGPAFNKVAHSALVAVFSRNIEKAVDYALRHAVPKCYATVQELLDDQEINAVYIATPPDVHEEYALAALKAGKFVYVEKPMALNAAAAKRMLEATQRYKGKLTIAHYRREQPVFKKIKALLEERAIGDVKFINLSYFQPAPAASAMADPKMQWRLNPAVAGGGLFHDLAPHQLDLMHYFFGAPEVALGTSACQTGLYAADDVVAGVLRFKNKAVFTGTWCFSVMPEFQKDVCEIIGSEGSLSFSIFGTPEISLVQNGHTETFRFAALPHVQQPMIAAAVNYFLDLKPNPCSPAVGFEVMHILDQFTLAQNRTASAPL